MDFPVVSILIVTYDRPVEIRRTIDALRKHVRYPRDKLRWTMADDGSEGNYVYNIQQDFKDLSITATISKRGGWAVNVNKGMKFCWGISDYVFLCEDDYVARRTINLEKGVALLMSKEDAGIPEGVEKRKPIALLRYDGLQAHWAALQLRESKSAIGNIHYLKIHHNSPFLPIYSNRPHLKHRRFHDYYGMYAEGQSLAATEIGFTKKVKQKPDGPWLCILEDGITLAFDHVGKSRQGTDKDVGFKK